MQLVKCDRWQLSPFFTHISSFHLRHREQAEARIIPNWADPATPGLLKLVSKVISLCTLDLDLVLTGSLPWNSPCHCMQRLMPAPITCELQLLRGSFMVQLDMVLRLGVSSDRIVFANACKRPRDMRAAASKQVYIAAPCAVPGSLDLCLIRAL